VDNTTLIGVHEYRRNGVYVARIHYTADPDKRDPAWIENEKEGATSAGWEREMEINFNVSIEKPFYPEFRYDFHVAKTPLQPILGRPILRGWDYGLTPATVFSQTTAKGQLLFFRELQSTDCGITNHGKVVVSESNTFYSAYSFNDIGDPAGNQRSQNDEKTANELLFQLYNISVQPGELTLTGRGEAVRYYLTTLTPDGQPMLLLDPTLAILIGGFTGGYHRKNIAGRLMDEPEKNEFSHLMDCLSYVCASSYKSRGLEGKNTKYKQARASGRIKKYGGM